MNKLVETPWLFINWEEKDYLDIFKEVYKDKLNLPEDNKDIIIYTKNDRDVYHIWRWWGYEWLNESDFNFGDPKFYWRAQRILWIKYIIENKNIRKAFFDTKNDTICLISNELEYSVVLKEVNKKYYKLITAFHTYKPSRYYTDKRFKEHKL